MKDFRLLLKLGEGLSVVNNDDEIPTIGELVNRKQEKRRQKGHRATVPLEVVGMDIIYGDGPAIGSHKYVLFLVDQCTTETFIYKMSGSSGSDVCEGLWNFLSMPVVFQRQSNVILIRVSSVVKLHVFSARMSLVSVLLHLVNKIKMVLLRINDKISLVWHVPFQLKRNFLRNFGIGLFGKLLFV